MSKFHVHHRFNFAQPMQHVVLHIVIASKSPHKYIYIYNHVIYIYIHIEEPFDLKCLMWVYIYMIIHSGYVYIYI